MPQPTGRKRHPLQRLRQLRGTLGRRRSARPQPARPEYRPRADGRPDPGEVCWAWVPFEEDPSRGKDRPVLVIAEGRDAAGTAVVHCLGLTSRDHDRDAAHEAAAGRQWMDIGTGAWDRERRPSEVRLNRLITLPADAVRREGAALDPHIFARVIAARADLQ